MASIEKEKINVHNETDVYKKLDGLYQMKIMK